MLLPAMAVSKGIKTWILLYMDPWGKCKSIEENIGSNNPIEVDVQLWGHGFAIII